MDSSRIDSGTDLSAAHKVDQTRTVKDLSQSFFVATVRLAHEGRPGYGRPERFVSPHEGSMSDSWYSGGVTVRGGTRAYSVRSGAYHVAAARTK
jgi:hypothetical protein